MSDQLKTCPACGSPAAMEGDYAWCTKFVGCNITGPNDDPTGSKWNALPRSPEPGGDRLAEDGTPWKTKYEEEREWAQRLSDERDGSVWRWMDEVEENYVESLCCPVLMSADQVRALVAEPGGDALREKVGTIAHDMHTEGRLFAARYPNDSSTSAEFRAEIQRISARVDAALSQPPTEERDHGN